MEKGARQKSPKPPTAKSHQGAAEGCGAEEARGRERETRGDEPFELDASVDGRNGSNVIPKREVEACLPALLAEVRVMELLDQYPSPP